MNKAFVREPESDGRAFCPRCGALGSPVEHQVLNRYVRPESRSMLGDTAWFCAFPRCDVAYFNLFDAVVSAAELTAPVYPKDLDAPICACFGLNYDDVAADVADGVPTRLRANMDRAKTAARCEQLAADGRSCAGALQELYLRLRGAR
ncbi:hypothetical protein [Lacipirellula sp.]|uniref:hypothetical protein n=1 Tax=Lacipirellula sp. TaxID=2691419 RepID=UPI003D0CD3F2